MLELQAIQFRSFIESHHNCLNSKKKKVCKILVDIAEGEGGGGQEWGAKLGFHSLLSLSLSIKKTYFKNYVC